MSCEQVLDQHIKGQARTGKGWPLRRRALNIKAYPSIVFFDEIGEIISPIEGYKSAEDLEIYLRLVASNDYKKVKTFEEWKKYQENFSPKFKSD